MFNIGTFDDSLAQYLTPEDAYAVQDVAEDSQQRISSAIANEQQQQVWAQEAMVREQLLQAQAQRIIQQYQAHPETAQVAQQVQQFMRERNQAKVQGFMGVMGG